MKNLVILFSIIAFFGGCKKKSTDPQLPDTTHTGANTFGCLIDGKAYTLIRKASFLDGNGISANSPTAQGYIYIGASNVIGLNFQYSGSPGTFEMADQYPYHGYYWNTENGTAVTGGNEYKTNSINKGAVTVTYYDGHILAGTFWFDGANDSSKVVHVTNGRFDITL